jgi:hypothetical protein
MLMDSLLMIDKVAGRHPSFASLGPLHEGHQRKYVNILMKCSVVHSRAVSVDSTLATYVDFTIQLIVAMSVDFSAIFINSPCSYILTNTYYITNTVSASPVFIPLGLLVFVAAFICGRMYLKAQLAIKREMSNAKAPILAQ